jgi:redox-sensitive bicupin YhaK (pirin superfamily)
MMKILKGHWTKDGAGVKIFRIFSNETVELTDPFLLLDHFGSDNIEDYIKGFPWHPHRGIETVTYLMKGEVEHQDNIGNKGVIGPGDIQWMSAGSGIIHQEMPQGKDGMNGFQLWVNMPAKKKMSAPKYRGIEAGEIESLKKEGAEIKVIAGEYEGIKGKVTDLIIDVAYLDVTLDNNKSFSYIPKENYTTLCCVVSGKGNFSSKDVMQNEIVLFSDVNKIDVKSDVKSDNKLRFLLISAKPLKERIAWGGPIVMNSEEELELAFQELQEGTFIKTGRSK